MVLKSPDELYRFAVRCRHKWFSWLRSQRSQCRDVEVPGDTCLCHLPPSALPEAPHPGQSLKLKEGRPGTLSTILSQSEGQFGLKTHECRAFQHPFVPQLRGEARVR